MAQTERLALGPLTAAEQKQSLRAIEQAQQLQAEILSERNGRPFGSADAVLDKLRDERTSTLS